MNKGRIKVSVMYPDGPGKTFDMDYYTSKHFPMVKSLMGDAILSTEIDKGIAGGAPGTSATYQAVGYMYFESMESFQKAMAPNGAQIMGDVPNYTNIEPVIQISEVVL